MAKLLLLFFLVAGSLAAAQLEVPEATSGFMLPVPDTGGGFSFPEDSRDAHPQPYQCWAYHPGWDLNAAHGDADLGTPVLAAANGVVVVANKQKKITWGRLVVKHLYMGQTVYTQYGHVAGSSISVSAGDVVTKGQKIAEIGKEGTNSAHLHFEVRTSLHPAPLSASFWQDCSHPNNALYQAFENLSNVQTWYQDPKAFVVTHPPYSPLGTVSVGATLDDAAWSSGQSPVGYYVSSSLSPVNVLSNTSLPTALSNLVPGLYTLTYNGGGPPSSTLTGILPCGLLILGPTCAATLNGGQTLSFTLQFQSNATLIHQYSFQGNVNDSIGGANGTLVGGATATGGKLVLNGSGQYAEFASHIVPTSGSYSVSLVAQELTQTGLAEFISQGFSGGPGFFLGYRVPPIGTGIRLTDSWLNVGVPMPTDHLSHAYALVVDATANASRFYLDGALMATLPVAITTTSGGSDTRLGSQFGGFGEYFNGSLADVRVYSGALTAQEVESLSSRPTGSMNLPRLGSAATVLDSGLVLVTGGTALTASGSAETNTAELYDPQAGTWRYTKTVMNFSRGEGHTATKLLNGKVLIAGGTNGTLRLTTAEIFDPASETFTLVNSMHDARTLHAAILLNDGRVMVAGGIDHDFLDYGSAEIYDPSSGTWVLSNTTLQSRWSPALARLLDGRVLFTGGGSRVDLFNPASNSWTPLTPLLFPRSTHTASVLPDGRVLVAGGNDGFTASFTAEIYDVTANGSTGGSTLVPGTMTVGGWKHSAVSLPNGDVFLAGGHNPPPAPPNSNSTDATQLYSFALNQFVPQAPMLKSRTAFPMVLLSSGQLLIVGGVTLESDVPTILNDVETRSISH